MKITPFTVLLFIATITCLFLVVNAGMSKDEFLAMVRAHRNGDLPKTNPTPQVPKKQQYTTPFSHLSEAQVKEQMAQARKQAVVRPVLQDEIYAPGMESQQPLVAAATTTSSSGVVVEDDQHTKDLKRRAVIALAVFLPLLLLAFVAFFVFIFVFSKGSNRTEKKSGSQNSRKSANSAGSHTTTKTEKSERSHNESSVGGGSRTRNNISTTI